MQNKKPIYKKWWFLLIIISIILVVGGITITIFQVNNKNNDNGLWQTSSDFKTATSRSSSAKSSTDKYTWYVKYYAGRNASDSCTYRLNGQCMDSYGNGNIAIKFITEDGSKVTEDNISEYVVESQDVEPDTEIKYTFAKDSNGEELNFLETQNIEEITLRVRKIENKWAKLTIDFFKFLC